MKKLLLLGLALVCLTVLMACDAGKTPADTATDDVTATEIIAQESEPADTTTPEEETTVKPEEITTEEVTTAAIPIAGMDSGIVRDGTPKKYITLSFDDGITQDARMIEIMKKYNVYCCTFNINTGLFGANWTWVGPAQFNNPNLSHLRFTRQELETGIYDGFDIACHTATHPSLKNLSERQVTREIRTDESNITEIFGVKPVGMAWPGGDTEFNDDNIVTILKTTDIRYARCTTRTGTFELPEYFMRWYPTCSFFDADCMSLVKKFIKAECTEDMLLYIWDHSYALDGYDAWAKFELLIKTISEAAAEDEQIVLVTNSEFYQLFKDEIPAWKE